MRNILNKKRLTGTTQYSYCPYCWQELSKQVPDPKANLMPVWFYKELVRVRTAEGYKNVIEEFYTCDRCKKELKTGDWEKVYCAPYTVPGEALERTDAERSLQC